MSVSEKLSLTWSGGVLLFFGPLCLSFHLLVILSLLMLLHSFQLLLIILILILFVCLFVCLSRLGNQRCKCYPFRPTLHFSHLSLHVPSLHTLTTYLTNIFLPFLLPSQPLCYFLHLPIPLSLIYLVSWNQISYSSILLHFLSFFWKMRLDLHLICGQRLSFICFSLFFLIISSFIQHGLVTEGIWLLIFLTAN